MGDCEAVIGLDGRKEERHNKVSQRNRKQKKPRKVGQRHTSQRNRNQKPEQTNKSNI